MLPTGIHIIIYLFAEETKWILILISASGYNRHVFTVKQAAEKIGVTDRHIRWLLKNGDIQGRKLGRDWIITSLEYKRKRKRRE